MQIKIGNKIRELRHRDGKKQEDLANALGVTNQAVSRWEKSAGYPDIEMIPAIANYFHISIDELFGYNGDREEKIKRIISQAEKAIVENEDLTDCLAMLREATEEFPDDYRLMLNLGFVLHTHGWKVYGLKGGIKEGSDYGTMDVEYNAKNVYWQEAMRVFEKLLKTKADFSERDAVILIMVADYSKMGETDKAKALAEKQNSIIVSRECLMTHAAEDDERDKYLGEAIIALMNELKKYIEASVTTKKALITSGISVKKLLALADFYKEIFDDGCFGTAHINMRDLYMCCAILEAKYGDIIKATEFFDIGFNHHEAYKAIRCTGEYRYSSPLVSKVSFPSENLPKISEDSIKDWLNAAPQNLLDEIKKNQKYREGLEI